MKFFYHFLDNKKGASKIRPSKYGSQNHHSHPKIHHYN